MLDFNFASSDVDNNGPPVSRTADALQTVVASDHDYGQHIRIFRLGFSEENGHNSLLINNVLWDSAADPSKVLNTLILLMVRKASMMESFLYVLCGDMFSAFHPMSANSCQRWDTPIELSGAVYQALHKIQSLRHLRVRLDTPTSTVTTVRQVQAGSSLPIQHPPLSAYPTSQASYPKLKRPSRKRGSGGYSYWANGRAFSGFKHLTSLALLGISSHDCLAEIAECLRASSSSLKSLTLSIANELALKARKPLTQVNILDDGSDTDVDADEEDQLGGPSLLPGANSGQTANEADIRKEKLAQENILAKIFDLQTVAAQGKKLEKSVLRPPAATPSKAPDTDDSTNILDDLKSMLTILLEASSGAIDSAQRRREAHTLLKKVAYKYGNMSSKTTKKPIKESSKQTTAGGNKFPTSTQPSSSSKLGPESEYAVPASFESWQNLAGPQTLPGCIPGTNIIASSYVQGSIPPAGGKQTVTYPDSYMSPYMSGFLPMASSLHFGLDHVDKPSLSEGLPNVSQQYVDVTAKKNKHKEIDKVEKEIFDFDWAENGAAQGSSNLASLPLYSGQEVPSQDRDQEDSMDIDMEHPDETTIEAYSDEEMPAESEERETIPRKRARFAAADSTSPATLQASSSVSADKSALSSTLNASDSKSADEEMRDYIRATHGLHLEELSLYLIPLKASILARALDLNVLKRITLLSVGPQDPFWVLLTKIQHHSAQIAFESIHTDNVSISFLEFLKTFDGLKELFLLERKAPNDAESGSTKAAVNITMIRKAALRKHIKTLKRLAIRNENDETWDLDANGIRFLSNKGGGLTEVAISLSMKQFVSFGGIYDFILNG